MDRLKRTLGIISTNWIHLVGFYVTTYFSMILFNIIGLENYTNEAWNQILFLNLIMIPFLFFSYGLMFIGGFFGAIITLDSIGFNLTKTKTKNNLILDLEWIIIIPPFVTWAFEYDYWLWLTLIISFALTQWIRKSKVEKIIIKSATKSATANSV